jgi:2-haloacid dehalogenase
MTPTVTARDPAVETLVFDFGNVLWRWHPRYLYPRVGLSEAQITAFLDETGFMAMNTAMDANIPFADGIATMVQAFPHHEALIRAFDTRWLETIGGVLSDNVALIGDAKRAGLAVHAISNFSRAKYDVARAAFDFLGEIEDTVLSFDVGLMKPDPAIYTLLAKRRGFDPRAAVFIDDNAENCAGAQAANYRTIHVPHHDTDVRAALRGMGVPV